MRTRWKRTNPFQAVAATVGLWGICTLAAAQLISDPSFEANSFTTSPGCISTNPQITDWTSNDPAHAGLNAASGSPFADKVTIPAAENPNAYEN